MVLGLRAAGEQLRRSLFFVPMLFVLSGAGLGVAAVEVDQQLEDGPGLPFVLTSTVDSARAVLETVASATITVAGIAFSVALLVIQLASSQYSPRIVHGLLRDRFSKRVMGVVAGTFTYCLVVLRAVRGPLEDGGTAIVPNLSVALAVLLGVMSILAIVAFIDHSAHAMDVSQLLARGSDDGISAAKRLWSEETTGVDQPVPGDPPDDHLMVRHDRSGWIQQIDLDKLAAAGPEGTTVRLECEVGDYALAGTVLCRMWPPGPAPERCSEEARAALVVGRSRTSEQDVTFAVRQLADVALRALSPGVNDPTTAQEAILHVATVLTELLGRQPPALVTAMPGPRVLIRPRRATHRDVIHLGFDEVRIASRSLPDVAGYLLDVLDRLQEVAPGDGDAHRALAEQAQLVRAGLASADQLLPSDVDRVLSARTRPTAHGG